MLVWFVTPPLGANVSLAKFDLLILAVCQPMMMTSGGKGRKKRKEVEIVGRKLKSTLQTPSSTQLNSGSFLFMRIVAGCFGGAQKRGRTISLLIFILRENTYEF